MPRVTYMQYGPGYAIASTGLALGHTNVCFHMYVPIFALADGKLSVLHSQLLLKTVHSEREKYQISHR